MNKMMLRILILTIAFQPAVAAIAISRISVAPKVQAAETATTIAPDVSDPELEIINTPWTDPVYDEPSASEKSFVNLATQIEKTNNMTDEVGKLFELTSTEKIVMGQDDFDAVKEGKVDNGLLETLIYLVTPVDQEGAGFERLRVSRLVKNYSTDRRATSRESEYDENTEPNISAHYKGQAVDISEIDVINFKKVTKKQFKPWGNFGPKITYKSSTSELPSVPINVVWQSEKGKGEGMPSFAGNTANQTFENLSLGGLKLSLGDAIEYNTENIQGSSFPEWAQSLGGIMLGEDMDLPEGALIMGENVTKDNYKTVAMRMGKAYLAKQLDLSSSALQGNNAKDLAYSIGRGLLEKKLELIPGSLVGDNVEEIAKNAGKRKIENELKLIPGTLDGDFKAKFKEIKASKRWQTYGKNAGANTTNPFLPQPSSQEIKQQIESDRLAAKESAFDIPEGSANYLEKGDERGLMLVGMGVLAYTLSATNKKDLFKKIKNKEAIEGEIKIDDAGLRTTVEPDTLKNLISKDKNKRRQAILDLGEETVTSLAVKQDISLGLSKGDWQDVVSGKAKIDDLAMKVGARKYEQEFNLPTNAIFYNLDSKNVASFFENIGKASLEEQGKNPNNYTKDDREMAGRDVLRYKLVASLNKKYKLTDKLNKYKLTENDVERLLNGDWSVLAQKISGRLLERAMRLPQNGVMDIVTGQKTPEQVLKQTGAVMLGNALGINRAIPVDGNLYRNYGQAIVEDTLGLEKGSFINSVAWATDNNPAGKFKKIFSFNTRVDTLLGLSKGTTKKFMDYTITIGAYQEKVAQKKIVETSADKLIARFGWDDKYKISASDINLVLNVVKNWKGSSASDKGEMWNIFKQAAGRSHDQGMGVTPGTSEKMAVAPTGSTKINSKTILLDEGMYRLNDGVFGSDKPIITLTYQQGKPKGFVLNGDALEDWGSEKIGKATGITSKEDTNNFLTGNYKEGFMCWGIASMTKEANGIFDDNKMPAAKFTYADARKAYYGDATAEAKRMDAAQTILLKNDPWASSTEIQAVRKDAKIEVRGQFKKDFQYKTYDAFLIKKVDKSIPAGFAKAMFEGTPNDRALVMGDFLRNKYVNGTIILRANQGVAMKKFLDTGDMSGLQSSGVGTTMDNLLNQNSILGFKVQPGTSMALLKMTKDKTAGLKDIKNIYTNWATSEAFKFFDKKLGFPAGQTYQLYKTYQTTKNAYTALKTAKLAGDATKIATAQKAATAAKAGAYSMAMSLVLGKTLMKLDEKLGLAPGTTENIANYFLYGDSVSPVALVYLAIAIISNIFATEEVYYGSIPVCERTAKNMKKTFFNKNAGWERISGDNEKDYQFYQRHAICSVRRMTEALLNAGKATGDPNAQPTQIMILRPEDADLYANLNAEVYGKTAESRGKQGVFWSEYFWQYVHVGY